MNRGMGIYLIFNFLMNHSGLYRCDGGYKMDKDKKKIQVQPQDWTPPASVTVAYKIWRAIFAISKVVAGAVATVLLIVLVCGFVFAGMLGDFLEGDIIPEASLDLSDLTLDLNSTIYYVDANGQFQIQQEIDAKTDRKWVTYEEIPEDMIHAAIAVEDHRFYKHQGVDWVTTIQACARMFFGDSSVGGSSITQQLIKNTFGNPSVTVQRKLLEIFQATEMEKRYDKQTILEYYLNVIYLGQNCNGVKTAAETYYGKELEKLSAAECASIIAITNSPTYYDPYQNPENNRERKETVLWLMRNQGFLTEEEYQTELNRELKLKYGMDFEDKIAQCENEECLYRDTISTLEESEGVYYCPICGVQVQVEQSISSGMYSYHTEAVIKDVAKALAAQDGVEWTYATQEIYMQRIQNGGYHIYSTLNWEVQQQLESIYYDLDNIPSVRGAQQLQSAMVVIDNATGDIAGLIGGTGEKTEYFGWDRTDTELQSGSSIKPISVYGPAFELGAITPASVVTDLPLNYNDGNWPRNDNRKYNYARTIYSAVTSSVNAVCAWTLDMIGTDYSFDFAKNKFGISTLVDEYIDSTGVFHSDNDYAPLAMGAQTWGVTVRDMAAAFATYANNGVYREARTFTKVFDSQGNLVIDNTQSSEQIVSQKTVDYMNYCLVNATRHGTGTEADLYYSYGITTAGKTGTTTSNKDRWYCGFTGYYTAAVWCGFDQPEAITTISVYNPSAVLFKKVMAPLHKGLSNISLYDSSLMKGVTVCLDSGKVATSACSADVRANDSFTRTASSAVYSEDYPTEECDKHVLVDYCSGGGVATEYCKLFAETNENVKIGQKALVKMTQDEIDQIYKASGYGLVSEYKGNDWIYLVTDDGSDGVFKGQDGTLKQWMDAPYVVCSEHTEAAWRKYENTLPKETEPTVEETEPEGEQTEQGNAEQEQTEQDDDTDSQRGMFDWFN